MKLKFNSFDQIKLNESDSIDIQTINKILKQLAENDQSIIPSSSNIPKTWERKWINDPDNKSLYYNAGESVWVNVETIDTIIDKNEANIRWYASNDPTTRLILEELDIQGDESKLKEFYKQYINGYNEQKNRSLYYIGDITKPIQIRISLEDNNIQEPSDHNVRTDENPSGKWMDFFKYQTDDDIKEEINVISKEQITSELKSHLINMHFDEISSTDRIVNDYLNCNLNNIKTNNIFLNHKWYNNELTPGFDFVKQFVKKTYNGGVKWFRLWNSGFLEHGGIISTSQYEDTLDKVDCPFYTVNLKWKYGNSFAKVYNYENDVMNSFLIDKRDIIDIDESPCGTKTKFNIVQTKVGSVNRPIISLTPYSDKESYGFTYSISKFNNHLSREICEINNDKFTFLATGQKKYTYYISGFVS